MSEPAAGTSAGVDVAVIGAGVIGCAVGWALTKAGRRVLLIDRADPATAGASFGNVGHIATEQLQPLPSPALLFNFWRELMAFGGVLDIPLRRVIAMTPWMMRFARAAFRLEANTRHLSPLVSNAADALESQLAEVGASNLIRRNGHYAIWLGPHAVTHAAAERARASSIGVPTADAPTDLLRAAAAQSRASAPAAAGVWFPATAHVLDPALVARAFATGTLNAGGAILRSEVRHVRPKGDGVEVVTDNGTFTPRTTVICTGAWSAPLLAPFRINAPVEAERGYHIELPNHQPLIDAPVLYADHSVVVTPMASRLRASTFLEFAGLQAPADPDKPRRLRAKVQQLGYNCAPEGPSWMGPRPTLPDYLPGIGRARTPHELYYAIGHQHLGLTLSAVTADLVAALVTGRTPRYDVKAFDLQRFGSP